MLVCSHSFLSSISLSKLGRPIALLKRGRRTLANTDYLYRSASRAFITDASDGNESSVGYSTHLALDESAAVQHVENARLAHPAANSVLRKVTPSEVDA